VLSFPFDSTLYLRGSAVPDGVVVEIATLTSKLRGKADAVRFFDDRCRERIIVGAWRCLRSGKQGNERCHSHRCARTVRATSGIVELAETLCAKSQKHIT
jgi:hypothetical protein